MAQVAYSSRTVCPIGEIWAWVVAEHQANEAGEGKLPLGQGKGGPDWNTYSLAAVMVSWTSRRWDSMEPAMPLSAGTLGMVLKEAFGEH